MMMVCHFCYIFNQFMYSPEELPTDDVSKQQLLLPASVILNLDKNKHNIIIRHVISTIFAKHDLLLSYFHCYE